MEVMRSVRGGRAVLSLGIVTVLFAAACAPGNAPAAQAPAPEPPKALTKVPIELVSLGAPYAHYMVADAKGYYAEEGIQAEFTRGANAAALTGEAPFSTSGSAVLSAILRGADMKIIITNADRPSYELWSSDSSTKTLKDLAGKSVGINSRGDTMEISTRLVLAKAGVDPKSVAFTPLTSNVTRLAALESGSVSAAILGIADVQRLKEHGAKGQQLADIQNDVQMLFNGVATSDKLIRENPGLVERFLRATIKGREYEKRYKEQTLAILEAQNHADRAVNEADYESTVATMTGDGTMPDDVQTADAQVRTDLIGVSTLRPMNQIYDYSFVRKAYAELKRTGWQPEA